MAFCNFFCQVGMSGYRTIQTLCEKTTLTVCFISAVILGILSGFDRNHETTGLNVTSSGSVTLPEVVQGSAVWTG